MVMVEINGVPRYFDGYMASNLEILKEAVRKNFDGVIYIGGYEGNGKSTLAQQFAAFVDPTFCVERICFSIDEVEECVKNSEPGQAVIYDESWKDVNSGAKYSASAQKFIRILTENRKKRLFIFVVAATFFDINKYLLIHRSRAYIEVYTKGLTRGFFSFYDRERKKDMYIRGKRDWNMNLVKPTFRGSFLDWKPINEDEYEAKKDKAIRYEAKKDKGRLDEKEAEKIRKESMIEIVDYLKRNRLIKAGGMAFASEYIGIHFSTFRDKANEILGNPLENRVIELKTSGFVEKKVPEAESDEE